MVVDRQEIIANNKSLRLIKNVRSLHCQTWVSAFNKLY